MIPTQNETSIILAYLRIDHNALYSRVSVSSGIRLTGSIIYDCKLIRYIYNLSKIPIIDISYISNC